MSIKNKLNFITFIVVSFALVIIGLTLKETLTTKSTIAHAKELNILSQKLSILIHETQKERGASAGFLGSKGAKFGDILPGQRSTTTSKYKELENYLSLINLNDYSKEFQNDITSLKSDMSRVNNIRSKIDSLNISVKDEVAYYTGMNNKILHIISLTAKMAATPELVKSLTAYTNFLKSKERAGIERAVLSGVFQADEFKSGVFSKWVNLVAEQNSYFDAFKAIATNDAKSLLKSKMNSPAVTQVNQMRAIAKEKAFTGEFGIDSVDRKSVV